MLKPSRILSLIVLTSLLHTGQAAAQSDFPIINWEKLRAELVYGASISPDGQYIFFNDASSNNLMLVNRNTNTLEWQNDGSGYRGIQTRWSPDGQYIAAWLDDKYRGNPTGIQVYDASTGHHLTEVEEALDTAKTVLRFASCCDDLTVDYDYFSVSWGQESGRLAAYVFGYIVVYDLSNQTFSTVIHLSLSNSIITNFDWSPDESRFAAFHIKFISSDRSVEMGFWEEYEFAENGYSQHEESMQDLDCVPYGDRVFTIPAYPIGSDVKWAPDNRTVAVSVRRTGQLTACSLKDDDHLLVKQVYSDFEGGDAPEHLQWSPDQRWLYGFFEDCRLLVADAADDYAYTVLPPAEAGNCYLNSLGWTADGRHVVLGTEQGLWLGTVRLPG